MKLTPYCSDVLM